MKNGNGIKLKHWKLKKMRLKTKGISVLPQELVKYYSGNRLVINGKLRTNFVSYKAMEMNDEVCLQQISIRP